MTIRLTAGRTSTVPARQPDVWPLATRATATALSLLMTVPYPALAQQLPAGGAVAAGTATISAPNQGTLNINQSSNQAIINWNSFSVGNGAPSISTSRVHRRRR
jgi:hypothetical protein